MRFRRPKGFTLIEVVAALAIVSIALLGLLRLHLISISTADKAQTVAQAALLAQERMAEVLCCGYPPVGTQSGVAEAEGSQFTWRTEVTEARSGPGQSGLNLSGLRKLSVDVAWRKGTGHKHVRMITYVAQSGIHE
jgi:general secretion pathway protein I